LAVADAYDALKADRPYRKVLTKETAIQELKRGKISHSFGSDY